MRLRTMITVGGIAVFIFFLVLIIFAASLERQPTAIIERRVDELLPTRKELPTEWKISSKTNISSNSPGFLEGVQLKISKADVLGGASATIKIYKFNTIDNANKYYMDIVTKLKEEGGYKEISLYLNAKAYGTFIESFAGEVSTIYFVKHNIYCEIRVAGAYYYDTRNDAINLARIILRKI